MFNDTPLRMQIHFLLLTILNSLQVPSNAIPFLYYRSKLNCLKNGEWQDCTEQELCLNNYEYKFVNTHGVWSISMDFGLICDKKLLEATMLSVGFFGQITAYLFAVFKEFPKYLHFHVIFSLFLVESLLLISSYFFHDDIYYVMFLMFQWNFCCSYAYSQVFTYINNTYTQEIKDKSVGMLNVAFPVGALLFITYVGQIDGYWVNIMAIFSGIPLIFLNLLFYHFNDNQYYKRISNLVQQKTFKKGSTLKSLIENNEEGVCPHEEAKEIQKNFILDLLQKFREIKADSNLLKNAIIFMICWICNQCSFYCPFIAFNSLGGDIRYNVLISVLADLSGSFLAFYLVMKFKCYKVARWNFTAIALVQVCSIFISQQDFYPQLIIILLTKISNRISFTNLISILKCILPPQYNQLTFSLTNLMSILFSTLLPFYRVFMEGLGISIFFGVGFITFFVSLLINKIKVLEQSQSPLYVKQSSLSNRLSALIQKRSSFSQQKKQSDFIIEQIVQRPSMIDQNIGFYQIDKTSIFYEKLLDEKGQQQLEIIHEEHGEHGDH